MQPVHCPLCGGSTVELFRVPDWIEGKRLFELKRCRTCRLAFLHPMPSEVERSRFRGSEDHYYGLVDAHPEEFRREASRLLELLEGVRRPPGRLLDVGAGRGLVLEEAARRGWNAVGVDASADACELARQRGLHVLEGDFLEIDLEPSSFDVILLQQVVEHSASPDRLLRRAREALRPDGVLFIGTPNGAGLLARTRGESFNYWIPPEHVFHYSPRALRVVLERNGFEVVRLRSFFCESALANDLRDICRHHPWLRRLPGRAARLGLNALRGTLERLGEGTILEALARPTDHER